MSWISNRAGVRPPEHRVETAQESLVRMRDGVRLRTVRISPRGRGIHPTILIRTPYNIGWRTRMPVTPLLARLFAGRGYHVVLQDTRGRYGSDGKFYPFVHERDDGLDTLDWISGQPFFDGNLGMWGPSYVGYTQGRSRTAQPRFSKRWSRSSRRRTSTSCSIPTVPSR